MTCVKVESFSGHDERPKSSVEAVQYDQPEFRGRTKNRNQPAKELGVI